MSRHRREWKARRKYTHPRPDNKVLAKRKRNRKKRISKMREFARKFTAVFKEK